MKSAVKADRAPINIWRIAFYIAALSAVAAACLPDFPAPPQVLSDKLVHFGAFTVLTALAVLAFPKAHWSVILAGLTLLGGGIELIQSSPWINRNAEVWDLVADMLAICTTLILFRACSYLLGKLRSVQAN